MPKQQDPEMLSFEANVAKMGDKRLIIIPKSMHYMLKSFEDKDLIVMIKKIPKI